MLNFIDTPDDVLALTISGGIKGGDLDAIMDRLDRAMAGSDRVHVFVETIGIDSLEIGALPSYIARALPLFGKLNRFGRVAVVADQAWVRLGTLIESAMLPSICYKTFEPEQRDEALNWVLTGEEA